MGIALRPGDEQLRDRLDAALDAIVADGTYAAINAHYFPFPIRGP
jgi:polar amino acid transport system substrate-binding protein